MFLIYYYNDYKEYRETLLFFKNNFASYNVSQNFYFLLNNTQNINDKYVFKTMRNFHSYGCVQNFKQLCLNNSFDFIETNYQPRRNIIIKNYQNIDIDAQLIFIENINTDFWTIGKLSQIETPTNFERVLGFRNDNDLIFYSDLNLSDNNIKCISRQKKAEIDKIINDRFCDITSDFLVKTIFFLKNIFI